jgi:hypothetical protein
LAVFTLGYMTSVVAVNFDNIVLTFASYMCIVAVAHVSKPAGSTWPGGYHDSILFSVICVKFVLLFLL